MTMQITIAIAAVFGVLATVPGVSGLSFSACNYAGNDTLCASPYYCNAVEDGVCYQEQSCDQTGLCGGKVATDVTNTSNVIQTSYTSLSSCRAGDAPAFSLPAPLPIGVCTNVDLGSFGTVYYLVTDTTPTVAPTPSNATTPTVAPTPSSAAMIYTVAVTFDVDFNELDDADKETLKTLAKTAFCTRITAAGVTCVAADLSVALSAGTAGRARTRQTGTTIATVTLPAGTTSAQATAITNDVVNTPVVITDENGETTTSTGASYTAAPVGTDGSDSAASTGAQAFPALVALAAFGASMVL